MNCKKKYFKFFKINGWIYYNSSILTINSWILWSIVFHQTLALRYVKLNCARRQLQLLTSTSIAHLWLMRFYTIGFLKLFSTFTTLTIDIFVISQYNLHIYIYFQMKLFHTQFESNTRRFQSIILCQSIQLWCENHYNVSIKWKKTNRIVII